MILLGVPMPSLKGSQVAIDLFPEPTKRNKRSISVPLFQEFVIVRLPLLEQRHLWEGFQRVLKMTEGTCWGVVLRDALIDVSYFEDFSRPRNKYLYRAGFWPPLSDLVVDTLLADFNNLFGKNLDIADEGFLLRLCFSVYRLFEQLMTRLGFAIRGHHQGTIGRIGEFSSTLACLRLSAIRIFFPKSPLVQPKKRL